ncbi:hypothetical protein HBF32_08495 [Luteibacter yeojuensis]|uniref:Uncharacterized protein n=1 Tax=Luteibacter yeojuensis TaxID=345309 RepID=A0A7X5QUD8_9GAMM|nr:hypothetical protein [Luteibacter yeojuensis]
MHLGTWNTVAGPAIAAAKTSMVLFFFMKLRKSRPAVRFPACIGLAWLAITVTLTLAEFLMRFPVMVR